MGQCLGLTLDTAFCPFQTGEYKPSSREFYINILNNNVASLRKVFKKNTASIPSENGTIMLKDTGTAHEIYVAKQLLAKGLPVLQHARFNHDGTDYLIRYYTTPYSLGDLVYAYMVGDFKHMLLALDITDETCLDPGNYSSYYNFKEQLRNKLASVIPNVNKILAAELPLAITLDNIDLNGFLYDFGDYPTNGKVTNYHVVSCMRQIATFCSLDITQFPSPLGYTVDRPKLQQTLITGSYIDKLLAINALVASNPETPATASTLFIEASAPTTQTAAISNPILGMHVLDWDLIKANHTGVELDLIQTQDPSIYAKPDVLSVGDTIFYYGRRRYKHDAYKRPFYDLDLIQRMNSAGLNLSETTGYHYQCGTTTEAVEDFMYYNYNSPKSFDPSYLKSVYTYMRDKFMKIISTDEKLNHQSGAPRMSSMGVGVSGFFQKTVWNALPEDFSPRLLDTASKTVMPFSTNIVKKFQRQKKTRVRTLGGSSFITSSIFRMLHKPVTNKMVQTAQANIGPFLIGISKFNLGFHKYLSAHHPNGIEDCQVMGADYTKCDRSFPVVCRALSAALFYELGHLEPNNHWFLNEMFAFLLDPSFISGHIFNKPGGTTSGDSTTAFSNSFYNYFVHLYIQYLTFLTTEMPPSYQPLCNLAHQAFSTGNTETYDLYFSMADDLNSTEYFLHFLSDDSFIISKPTAFPIFTPANFSMKLQNVLGCYVDPAKSWSADGEIHEFCSSHICKINEKYQYVPDPNNMLAGLICAPEPTPQDKLIWKLVATCAELAVFHFVNPTLFNNIFHLLQSLHAEFVSEHSVNLLPPKLLEIDFYTDLIDSEDVEQYSFLADTLTEKNIIMQSASQCYFCDNATVSTCSDCTVQYPMCAHCAYEHLMLTDHTPTQVLPCHVCDQTDPRHLNHTFVMGTVKVACDNHVEGMALPLVDHARKLVKIPLYQKCEQQKTSVSAIKYTKLFDENDQPLDPNFFFYDHEQSAEHNYLKILNDCYLLDEHTVQTSTTYDFQCLEGNTIQVFHKPAETFGNTAYAEILDSKGRVVLKVTLDPISAQNPNHYYITTTKGVLYRKYSKIRRTIHKPRLANRHILNTLKKATFIIGPPGTGKTTYVMKNFIDTASPANKVAYIAPTHKLVQSMDQAIWDKYNHTVSVSVVKSELNNNKYNYPLNSATKTIMLGTPGAVCTHAGCTLIFDEVTLSQLNTIINAISVVKPSQVIFLGDPLQLGPVTHMRSLSYSYTNFPLFQFCNDSRVLSICYRCPSNIFNLWVKPYTDSNVRIDPHAAGGDAKIIVSDQCSNPDAYQYVQKLARNNPDKVLLCNYKKPIIGLENAVTIDSSQGKTYKHTIVVLLGNTNFTQVINRAIVAMSRSTHSIEVHCSPFIHTKFSELFGWPQNVEKENQITKQLHEYSVTSNITLLPVSELPNHLGSLVVCDLEFFHVRHETTPKVKCTLEVGEMAIITTSLLKQIIIPRKSAFTAETHHKHTFGVPKGKPDMNWDYMKSHKAISQQINTDRTHKIFSHMAATTLNRVVYVLYGAGNDLRALTNLNIVGDYTCEKCTKEATFYTIHREIVHTFCNHHAPSQFPLMGTINAQAIDIQHASANKQSLTNTHAEVCNQQHGDAHTASADTIMTGCLASNFLMKSAIKLDNILTTSAFKPYAPYIQTGSHLTVSSIKFRTLGTGVFSMIDDKLYHFDILPHHSKLSHFLQHSSNQPHSTIVTEIPAGYPSCVKIKGKGCTFCANTIAVITELYEDLAKLGLTLSRPIIQQAYTQVETQILQNITNVSYNQFGEMLIQLKDDTVIPFINDFQTSIHNYSLRSNQPLPNPAIFKNLGIKATLGFSTPWVPVTTTTTEPHIMSTKILKDNNDYYHLSPVQLKASPHAFSSITAGYYIYTTPMINIPNETPAYYLTHFVHGQSTPLDLGYTSTNRLTTKQFIYTPNEDEYKSKLGHHVSVGDTSNVSWTIGGMHVLTAFQNITNYQLVSGPANPIMRINVALERGNKVETTALDTTLQDYYKIATTNKVTVSKTTFFTLDGGQYRMMNFANPDGTIQTSYPVAQAQSQLITNYRIYPSYITWPTFFTNEATDCWAIPNYNAPPKNQTCNINIQKYDQMCDLFAIDLKIPVKGHIHHLGNAGNKYSPGDVVLRQYFDQAHLTSYDLREVVSDIPVLHPNDEWKAHFILSDVYAPDTDFTSLALEYMQNHLRLGGSIMWKMTETSILQVNEIVKYFGSWKAVTFAVNYSSSETFLFCAGYTGVEYNTSIVQNGYMSLLGGYRKDLLFVPFCNDYTGSKAYKDTGRVKVVANHLADKLTPAHYATASIFLNTALH